MRVEEKEALSAKLVGEKDGLEDNINRLTVFLNGQEFTSLSPIHQALLVKQRRHMTGYYKALCARIGDLS